MAVLLSGPVASAKGPDEADVLFRQGRAAAEAGDYARACVAFAASLRLDAAPGTLLNLGDCEEHTGHLASAWGHFLRLSSVVPASDERFDVARARAAALAPRVPWLVITLAPGSPADARVFCDDVELGRRRLGVPLPMDPGVHTVLVVAPGRASTTTPAVAVERETVRTVVSPGRVAPEDGPRAPPVHHTAAWLVGAAGIASLGVGTYFGARALAERSWSDAACMGGVCANAPALGEYQAAVRDARAADVALGVGVVALAVGGVLLLTSRSDAPAVTGLQVTATGVGGVW